MRTGRRVVVSGAAGGMGAEIVAAFLANGDHVTATDLSAEALEALALACSSDRLTTIVADVSEADACEAVAESAGPAVQVLVNAAGWFPVTPFSELSPETFRRVVDVNLTGPFLMCRAVVPRMAPGGWGRIVSLGSASIFDGVAGQSPYVAAKAGLVGLSKCLARELGPDGITVNVVTPGLTPTGRAVEALPPAAFERQITARAIKRPQRNDDVVGAVMFLTSPDAAFITGQTVNVDGGAKMP